MKNKFTFYLLSFTWGLPLTLIGCLVSLALLIAGKKPKKYGWCWYFEVGEKWGGLEFGPVFLVNKNASDFIKTHELGHGIQNIRYGFSMIFVVCIPSATRYLYRNIRNAMGKPCETKYYDIWFEAEANKLGSEFMSKHEASI